MERKIKRSHVDYGFGFPVKLLNVTMVRIRGNWTPALNYNRLAEVVLDELSRKKGRLTGYEVRFIRQHFEMTLQDFAKRFGVTHPGVMRWESVKDRITGMNWSTEKDIRLFIFVRMHEKSKELAELYKALETIVHGGKVVEIDVSKIAA